MCNPGMINYKDIHNYDFETKEEILDLIEYYRICGVNDEK